MHSEFRQSSAGVGQFNENDESFLRKSNGSLNKSFNRTRDSKGMTSPVKKKAPPKETPKAQEGLQIDIEEAELDRDEDARLESPLFEGDEHKDEI